MFIEQISLFSDYLKANRMTHTLETLRRQLAAKIPNKPSAQLLSLIDHSLQKNDLPIQKKEDNLGKKPSLLVDGLLGKIAYSSKLLDNPAVNDRISKLLDNKIFQKALGKMFPEAANRIKQMQNQHEYSFHDEQEQQDQLYSSREDPVSVFSGQQDLDVVGEANFGQQNEGMLWQSDEYTDDNDLGYHQFDFNEGELMSGCAKLTQKYGYPDIAIKKVVRKQSANIKKKNTRKFQAQVLFPQSEDKLYPLQYNGVIYDCMKISMIHNRQKIGYEETQQIQLKEGAIMMGRYQVIKVLGSGVFARVIKAKDLLSSNDQLTCFKVVSNNKDFLDQALDQIKLLRLIKANCNPDSHYLLDIKGAYYYRQHLFIQTDLLKDNLFSAYRKNPSFFSVSTIKTISKQILIALSKLHSLNIIHSDLKPENILIKSYNPVQIKVVDLGNSCFIHDNLGSYVQSRSYRAPQVILGAGYDFKIDVWSVGCIIAELWTKNVLFYNLHMPGMLARIQSILGPWPQWMLQIGTNVSNYFSKENLIFLQEDSIYHILIPKKTSLRNRIPSKDNQFINFMSTLLQVDPDQRPTAKQAFNHPFLK